MVQLASDNFNRANAANLGANWTVPTGRQPLSISSNVAVGNASGGNEVYTAITWPNDQYSEIAIVTAPTVFSCVRMATGADSKYMTGQGLGGSLGAGSAWSIWSANSGTYNTIASGTTTINANDVIRTEIQGTTLTKKLNGTVIDSATD